MALALLPYVFLTYQTRVPSRHTYLASAGLAMLAGAALHRLAGARPPVPRWDRAGAMAAVCLRERGQPLDPQTAEL